MPFNSAGINRKARSFRHVRRQSGTVKVPKMRFIEADCDVDWARFIVNDVGRFKLTQIRHARDQLRRVAKYYRDHVGQETYYPRIVALLVGALDRVLATASIRERTR